MKGTLEGLESCYDSPGLGVREISYAQVPRVGYRFIAYDPHGIYCVGVTGTVRSVRALPDEAIGFKTSRTTYIIKETD